MGISKRLKDFRRARSLTQSDLANAFNISQAAIAGYEGDKRSLPVDIAQGIAKRYNVNLHWLFTGEGSMFLDEQSADGLDTAGILQLIEQDSNDYRSLNLFLRNTVQLTPFRVSNDAMQPDIREGDVLFVETEKEIGPSEAVGRLCVISLGDKYELGRVLEADGRLFFLDFLHQELIDLTGDTETESPKILVVRCSLRAV